MRLTLRIENFRTLPDGGPTTYAVAGSRGFDIGRGQYQDWTLPDEARVVSGRHCEIRPQGDAYLLYDVSRNGTFVNGAETRVQSPYHLKHGDQLLIGPYVISVAIEGGEAAAPNPASEIVAPPASYEELWDLEGDVAPPISRKALEPEKPVPHHAEWIERPADLEYLSVPSPPPKPAADDVDWLSPSGKPPPPAPASPPEPRADLDDWAHASAPPPAPPLEPPPAPAPRRMQEPPSRPATDWTSDAAPSPDIFHASPPPAEPQALPEMEPRAFPEPPPFPSAAPQPAAPQPAAPHASAPSDGAMVPDAFLAALSRASGVPMPMLRQQGAEQLGETLGALMRLFVDETRRLLEARSASKRLTRSASQTVIRPQDNNPLKFSPTTDEALRILFGPAGPSYLDAPRAFAQAFADLKQHQLQTYNAMQQAVRLLAEDLDPKEIERAHPPEGGLERLMGSRKARLWDVYVARWDAKNQREDDQLVSAFMRYFADCYDHAARQSPERKNNVME